MIDVGADDVIVDMRETNGRVGQFDKFWSAMAKEIENYNVSQERRHSDVAFLPFAISINDLKQKIAKLLPAGTPIPSNQWISPRPPSTRNLSLADRLQQVINFIHQGQTAGLPKHTSANLSYALQFKQET